jgi:hypothetical protein
MAGHSINDWMSVPRTQKDIDANFLLRRLNNSGFVTAFYEDSQDIWPPTEQLWVPHKKPAADHPPALYYTKTFMKSRFKVVRQGGDASPNTCIHGQTTNQV